MGKARLKAMTRDEIVRTAHHAMLRWLWFLVQRDEDSYLHFRRVYGNARLVPERSYWSRIAAAKVQQIARDLPTLPLPMRTPPEAKALPPSVTRLMDSDAIVDVRQWGIVMMIQSAVDKSRFSPIRLAHPHIAATSVVLSHDDYARLLEEAGERRETV